MDSKKRSTLLAIASIGSGYVALRNFPALLPEKLELEPLKQPFGFRRYVAGESSGGFDPFAGFSTKESAELTAQKAAAEGRVLADICGALYGAFNTATSITPIASFSDYYCPFCRVQTKRLVDLSEKMPDQVAISWHELPLLGNTSNLAAKAALAAKRQGAYIAFHERLMRTAFQATPEYLSELSIDIGVDGEQLKIDMEGAEIAEELENSAALSRVFAFVGTPAMVIGRTVVQGEISDKMIRRIIDLERNEGLDTMCLST